MNETMARRDFMGTALCAAGATLFANGSLHAAEKVKRMPGGIVGVTVTPYNKDHSIDAGAMNALAARLSAKKIDGIFIAGSTGDMPLLEQQEREALASACRKGMSADTLLYAGVTQCDIPRTVESAKRMAGLGADIAVVMPPLMFFTFSQDEVAAWITAVADRSPIPVLMYHHVKAPTPIEPATVEKLADHPNIVAMKETGPSMERTADLYRRVKDKNFRLIQGNEGFAAASFKMGLAGAMSALAAVVPEDLLALWTASQSKNGKAFDQASARLDQLCKVFSMMPRSDSFSHFGWTLKRMLVYRGWLDNTNVRLAGFAKDDKFEKELLRYLDEIAFPKE